MNQTAMNQTELTTPEVNPQFGAIGSPIGEVLRAAMDFYQKHPLIEAQILELQDQHARKKKQQRIEDSRCLHKQSLPLFQDPVDTQPPSGELSLESGRPRMPARNVFLFAIARAAVGGPHSRFGETLIKESLSLRALLHPQTSRFPGASTILENINLIDPKTLEGWLKMQLHWLRAQEGSDEGWQQITVDSTAIACAGTFPVDSALLLKGAEDLWKHFERLYQHLGVAIPKLPKVHRWLRQIRLNHQRISMGSRRKGAKARRRQGYREMLHQAILLIRNLDTAMNALLQNEVRASSDCQGKHARQYRQHCEHFQSCRARCLAVIHQVNERVLQAGRIPVLERLLSHSEADAAIIVKGGREAIFGYKNQLAFNLPGYCTGAVLNHGNASDSASLEEVVHKQNQCSGVIAAKLSVDDGYAGKETAQKVTALGVVDLSVCGSKGKRQLGDATYAKEEVAQLRSWRSAAESRISTFKHNQQIHRLHRFGRKAAMVEILSKILIFNLDCYLRRRSRCQRPPGITAA